MQTPLSSSSSSSLPPNDDNNSIKSNNQILLERFLASIKSDVTRSSVLSYIHKYMRHWDLYEKRGGGREEGHNDNDDDDDDGNAAFVYRYDWLISEDAQTIQNKIIQFVIDKKKEGLGARAIDNYVNNLRKFYRVNSGIRGGRTGGIDWGLVKAYVPDYVKKTQDREYRADEVIAIEEKLDVRGKVVSGIMRGSGVRRGAERLINVGDLFPIQTKNYGKIYKIWVYRGTIDEYATACTPEVAKRIDDYFEYRMRFGEVCRLYGKSDHKHEYYDGYGDNGEVIERWYKADEKHLDPEAPLIREDFDITDSLAAKYPRRMSDHHISDIIRQAAIKAGVRQVNEGGNHYKRHRVMATHGLRKLFKKRCRQAKIDGILVERFMGHKSGNSVDGITKLMMTYDPEDWQEMQQEFVEKAIPHLTITKDALIQAELEQAKAQLKNVPTIEQLQARLKETEEQKMQQMQTMQQQFQQMRTEMDKLYRLVERQAFRSSKDMRTIQDYQVKLGEIPPLCPADTLPILSYDGIYPQELNELLVTPWAELEKPENKGKLRRLEELLRKVQQKSKGG